MRWTKRLRWRWGFLMVSRSQVRTGRPPETAATYARLRRAKVPSWRAYRLLAAAYEAEVAAMLLEGRVYDHTRYVAYLDAFAERAGHLARFQLNSGVS
jgi:hypothetical protein